MKYKKLLLALPEDTVFTPASIAKWAMTNGFGKTKLDRQRIRIALGRFSNNHLFPDEGDGMVTLKGQSPTPGWYGWRWKDACGRR